MIERTVHNVQYIRPLTFGWNHITYIERCISPEVSGCQLGIKRVVKKWQLVSENVNIIIIIIRNFIYTAGNMDEYLICKWEMIGHDWENGFALS